MNKLLVMGIFLLFCHNVFAATAKLQYLFVANGGLVGLYEDGNVRGCAQCDPMKENLLTMSTESPLSHWKRNADVITITDAEGSSDLQLYDNGKITEDWWIFDYKTVHPLY
ncbi:hypothetical protein ACY12_003384 [Salmonella enterica subsp. enterica serovar Portland]|uniref:Uncharacterized protein n=2 Tax=Salmonella enterica subsp. indica TaxID=59207 RepID=V1H3S6_SALER|nr:hypothetical protein [Salmonella enterica]EAW1720710.1 hypothetical protein [Salmonella enterica subsp. indica]EBF8124570.1 hypothetical protein [Salmonella enterica subsp. enterica]EBH9039873.1 hypothetical protein [Salmonella enterica subsp. indica serovar 11:b:e,n,x]EBY5127760.1 hypothetical protein [Salmonella enterica subsp. enterica serovar Brazzaville]EEJ9033469.1 hypothetical protein [Salmonella enterica subsp. enterica serovar Oslo]EEM2500942.1 hypothetical protein [Salmonella ent